MKLPVGYSLRTLLMVQFLAVAVLAGIVATVMMVVWRLPMAQKQVQTEQARAAGMVLQQLEVLLDTTETLTTSIGQMLASETSAAARDTAAALIARISGSAELFESLYVLDQHAKVIAMGSSARPGLQMVDWIGNDFSGLPVVQAVRRSRGLTWSEQFQSPVLGVPVVAVALPAGENIVLAEISVRRLVDFVHSSNSLDGLLVLVVDGKGETVAAPDMQLARTRSNLSNIPLVRAALDGTPVFGTFSLADQSYSGTARRSNRLGWVVVSAYPESVADAPRRVAVVITSVTLALSVGFGMFVFGAFANLMQRRVQRTVAYAQAVAQGHYESPGDKSVVREMQRLDASLEQMAQTIQRREQQLRAIVDTTPTLAIQWYDRSGRVLDWNPASVTMFGWTRDEALGQALDQLIYSPEQQQLFLDVLAGIEKTGQPFGPFEGTAHNRQGEERQLLSTTFSIPDINQGLQFVCMDIDITDMKQKEQEIRANEEKFNVFFNASPVAVAVLEKRGKTYIHTDVNHAWEQLIGCTRDQALASNLASSDFLQLLTQVKSQQIVTRVESWARRANGEQFLAEGSLGWVCVAGRELVIYSLHDITEKRQMENDLRELNAELEERIRKRTESLTQANLDLQKAFTDLRLMQDHLVQSEKLASLGALVAGIAHELNTPIGNGLMAISTLEQRAKTFRTQMSEGLRRSDLEAFLAGVETAGQIATRNLARAAELITSFKRVAVDQTSVQRRQFELAEFVHEILLTLQPMIKRSPAQVAVDIPALTIDGYPGPLGQVVSNLIQNSLVHAFGDRTSGQISISAQAQSDLIKLTVSDDGCGIPAELVRRVFDPFFTTRLGNGGSGLGLHIVHNIVTGMLGGAIDVQQQPGSGASFVITFPRCAPALAPVVPAA
ncbi:MAG: PAS domain S-box protein [Rhodoferax sp.]